MKIETVAKATKASAVPPSPMVIVLRAIAISAISFLLATAEPRRQVHPNGGECRAASDAES
jgi:hypothetical protein